MDGRLGGAGHAFGRERGNHRRAIAHPAKNAALRRDHGQGDAVELREVRGAGIADHHAAIAAIIALAHCGMHADFSGDATDQKVLNALLLQHITQFGAIKSAFTGFIDNDFAGARC